MRVDRLQTGNRQTPDRKIAGIAGMRESVGQAEQGKEDNA
jgi:hypothetical protein